MEPQYQIARKTIPAALKALGFEPEELKDYPWPTFNGIDPATGAGLRGQYTDHPQRGRIRFSSLYPATRDGRQIEGSNRHHDATVKCDRDPAAIAADIRRRVLEPTLAELPAVQEQISRYEAQQDRYNTTREALERMTLIKDSYQSHSSEEEYHLADPKYRYKVRAKMPVYGNNGWPTLSATFGELSMWQLEALLDTYKRF